MGKRNANASTHTERRSPFGKDRRDRIHDTETRRAKGSASLAHISLHQLGEHQATFRFGNWMPLLFSRLNLLRWREADLETYNLMQRQKVTNRDFDWLDVPSRDLHIIDRLWVQYSGGRFGFSVQKRIWEELHKRKDEVERIHGLEAWMRDTAGYDADYFIAFASEFERRVGWCGELRARSYEGLTFDISAPEGHFPARYFYAVVYHEGLCGWLEKLAKKLS